MLAFIIIVLPQIIGIFLHLTKEKKKKKSFLPLAHIILRFTSPNESFEISLLLILYKWLHTSTLFDVHCDVTKLKDIIHTDRERDKFHK